MDASRARIPRDVPRSTGCLAPLIACNGSHSSSSGSAAPTGKRRGGDPIAGRTADSRREAV